MRNNQIKITKGSLVNMVCDAIVNPANPTLRPGLGVNKMIFYACGRNLIKECNHLPKLKSGKATITGAYNSPAKYIIHVVSPYWYGGFCGEAVQLASCYIEALKMAEANGCESIAFPALSTGYGGYPVRESAEIAICCVKSYLFNHDSDIEVQFACYDADTLLIYRECVARNNINISAYLNRKDELTIDKPVTPTEKVMMKKKYSSKMKLFKRYRTITPILKRFSDEYRLNFILLPEDKKPEDINELLVKEHEGIRGPYIITDSIKDIKYNKKNIRVQIKPFYCKIHKEELAEEYLTDTNATKENEKEDTESMNNIFNVELALETIKQSNSVFVDNTDICDSKDDADDVNIPDDSKEDPDKEPIQSQNTDSSNTQPENNTFIDESQISPQQKAYITLNNEEAIEKLLEKQQSKLEEKIGKKLEEQLTKIASKPKENESKDNESGEQKIVYVEKEVEKEVIKPKELTKEQLELIKNSIFEMVQKEGFDAKKDIGKIYDKFEDIFEDDDIKCELFLSQNGLSYIIDEVEKYKIEKKKFNIEDYNFDMHLIRGNDKEGSEYVILPDGKKVLKQVHKINEKDEEPSFISIPKNKIETKK